MAEGWTRHYGMGMVEVLSAGVSPVALNPLAVRVMAEKDIDISGHRPKDVDAVVMEEMDLVVTLCDTAQGCCPHGPPAQHRLHWSILDPTGVWGPEWLALRAYRKTRDELESRIQKLLSSLAAQRQSR